MTATEDHQLVGGLALRTGPGFSTPIFQTRLSNGLWIQSIRPNETIETFLPASESEPTSIEYISTDSFRRVGDEAFYIYRDSNISTHISTRRELRSRLYEDYPNLSARPYLRRTIARFVDDRKLLQEAEKAIGARRTISQLLLFEEPLGDRRLEYHNLYVRTAVHDLIEAATSDRRNLIILGPRGIGKTSLLYHLGEGLKRNGNRTLFVAGQRTRNMVAGILDGLNGTDWSPLKQTDYSILAEMRRVEFGAPEDVRANLRIRLEQVIGAVEREIKHSPAKTTFLMDDFDYLFDKDSLSFTNELIARLLGANVQMILTSSAPVSEIYKTLSPSLINTFQTVALSTPSANEVSAMLRARLAALDWKTLGGLSVDAVAQLLHGFNFRQILYILGSANVRENEGYANIQNAVDGFFESWISRELWDSAHEHDGSVREAVRFLLDSAASGEDARNSITRPERYDFTDPWVRQAYNRLIRSGVLQEISVPNDNAEDGVEFSHRLLRELWLKRRATSLDERSR